MAQKKNRQIIASTLGIFVNVWGLSLLDEEITDYLISNLAILIVLGLLFMVIEGMVEKPSKLYGRALFIWTITTIILLSYKLVVTFLQAEGYI